MPQTLQLTTVCVTPPGTNATPGANVPPITGILSDPQFRMIIQAIQQHTGADILSMPRIATESGRQAHVAMSPRISAQSPIWEQT